MSVVPASCVCSNVLQGVYRAFSTNAKFVNANSVPHINFMAASVVELYGIDAGEVAGLHKGRYGVYVIQDIVEIILRCAAVDVIFLGKSCPPLESTV